MLLADVDRLRPLAEEADVRAQLLAENDLAQNELFRSLRERSSEVSTLSEALSTARAGWTAAADEAATLRSHLSVERAAAAERLELLHTTTEALQRQRDDSIAQSSALEALTRRADDLQQACDERAARASHESMEARIAVLEQACNERADLIDRLSAEAEMLRTVAAQRAEELAAVSDEAERRAVLIRELSRALDEDHPDGRLTIGPTDLRP
jgi:chromosome segregation ATPase